MMLPFGPNNGTGSVQVPMPPPDATFLCLNSGGPWTPLPSEKQQIRSEIASPMSLDSFGCAWPVMSQLAASPFNDRAHAFSFTSNSPRQSPVECESVQSPFAQLTPQSQSPTRASLQLLDPPYRVRLTPDTVTAPDRVRCASPPVSDSSNSTSSLESCSSQCASPTLAHVMDQDLLELKQMLQASKERAVPPSTYVCHSCGQAANHYIADCHKRQQQQSSGDAKTPYQGPNESFGQLRCERPSCGHRWTSTRCFANQPQNCKKCSYPVYPYKMFSLQKAIAKGLLTPDAAAHSPSQTAPPATPTATVFHY